MSRTAIAGLFLLAAVGLIPQAGSTQEKDQPPRIWRIAQVQIASSRVEAADIFYGTLAELTGSCNWCETPSHTSLGIYERLGVSISPLRPGEPPVNSLVVSVTFAIDDQKAMKRWLKAHNVPFQEIYGPVSSTRHDYLSVYDPEGHELQFVTGSARPALLYGRLPVIHAGRVVKDRAAMDKFYKDVLGFHVYWSGGMKDGVTDWVDMQVPDGTDWIEYMLNVPSDADKRLLGVMNHIALGVPDVHAAARKLEAKGMELPEEPKIGRDGKWQLNLYDPDGTRVELMEFTPAEKPCCAEYTGPHPRP